MALRKRMQMLTHISALGRDTRGQMTVELVCVMPIVLVLMIVVCDMMVYLGDCARFDRLAGQIVVLHAASPSADSYGATAQVAQMQSDLTQAMNASGRCSVHVSATGGTLGHDVGENALLSFIPAPQTYTCTLSYVPWPFQDGVFGFVPTPLTHMRSYVVDPYRPGILL